MLALMLMGMWAVTTSGADGTSLNCTVGFGGLYCPGRWVPVSVQMQNRTAQDIDGYLLFPPGQVGGTNVQQAVHVPAHSTVWSTALLLPGARNPGSLKSKEISTALWRSQGGAELDRTNLAGAPVSSLSSAQTADSDLPAMLVLTIDNEPRLVADDAVQGTGLASMLQSLGGFAAAEQSLSVTSQLPRTQAEYESYPVIVLKTDPEDLDIAQRQALLDHIRQGATLVIPDPQHQLQESWLAPYLPVEMVGDQLAGEIFQPGEASSIKLLQTLSIAQAVATDDPTAHGVIQIVLHDGAFVHAAVRRFGLGRIVFTSFPVAALDPSDGRTRSIWRQLLGISPQTTSMMRRAERISGDPVGQFRLLLGRPAPTWKLAVIVGGGYLLVVLLAQLLVGSVHRPWVFSGVSLLAVLIAGSLMLVRQVSHGGDPVSGARLTTVELSADGQGRKQEQVAFFGRNEADLSLIGSSDSVMAQPILFDAADPPTLVAQPFSAPMAGSRAESVRRIWQATAAYSSASALQVTGMFGPTGLVLRSENTMNGPVESPLLAWGAATVRLANLPRGYLATPVTSASANPIGIYTNWPGMIGSIDQLRGRMIEDALESEIPQTLDAPGTVPTLLGWLDMSSLPPLLEVRSPAPLQMRGQTLLRVPVCIQPATVGSMVHIDGIFNRLGNSQNSQRVPADGFGRVSSSVCGAWLLEVKPPAQIGTLRPTHAIFTIDLDAPQHVIILQAGQYNEPVQGKDRTENTAAPVLATWTRAVGPQTVSLDVGPGDLSPDGLLVFRFEVEPAAAIASGLAANWAVHSLAVSIDAQVTGAPTTPPLEREAVEAPPPLKKSKKR